MRDFLERQLNKRKAEKLELNVEKVSRASGYVKCLNFFGTKLARANHDEVVGKFRITLKNGGPGKPKVKTTSVHINEREELILNEGGDSHTEGLH